MIEMEQNGLGLTTITSLVNVDVSSPLASIAMVMILLVIGIRYNIKQTILASFFIIGINYIVGNTGFTPYLIGLLVFIVIGKIISNGSLWEFRVRKNNSLSYGGIMKSPSFTTKLLLSFGLLKVKQKPN